MPEPTRPSNPRRERAAADPAGVRRSPGAIATSVVVHVALVLLLAQAIGATRPLGDLFRLPARPVAEAVTYVEPRRAPAAPEPEGGGDGRAAAAPRVVAPVATPSAVPPPAPNAAPIAEPTPALPPSVDGSAGRGAGTGTGVGALAGPAAGLRPTYTDSPVWARPCLAHECPETLAERLDSVVAGDLAAVRDSIIRAQGARRPGDWTFGEGGDKWGMDEQYIRLGKISIPNALWASLVNFGGAQANPNAVQRRRTLEPMYGESRAQGLRRRNDATFDDVVQSIRERKDRERAERRATLARRDTTRRAP